LQADVAPNTLGSLAKIAPPFVERLNLGSGDVELPPLFSEFSLALFEVVGRNYLAEKETITDFYKQADELLRKIESDNSHCLGMDFGTQKIMLAATKDLLFPKDRHEKGSFGICISKEKGLTSLIFRNGNDRDNRAIDSLNGLFQFDLSGLEELDLGGNYLNIGALSVRGLPKLGNLDVSGNLFGTLELDPAQIQTLEHLNVSHNKALRGEILSAIVDLEALKTLDLSYTSLNSSLPEEIGNLQGLETLWARGANLKGSLPTSIGGLGNLKALDLSHNDLTGRIPEEITMLTDLTKLLLEGNQLSGSLPSGFINLQKLVTLNLSYNDLTSSIPEGLLMLPKLKHLDLKSNGFTHVPCGLAAALGKGLDLRWNPPIRVDTEADDVCRANIKDSQGIKPSENIENLVPGLDIRSCANGSC